MTGFEIRPMTFTPRLRATRLAAISIRREVALMIARAGLQRRAARPWMNCTPSMPGISRSVRTRSN
ncbi:hypothetical protein D3C72_2343010 [compost metagenome]